MNRRATICNGVFTGQERDSESTLDYFHARYFSGPQGRFTGVDPENAGAALGDPQSWNGYAYVSNNPLSYTDPSGLGFWSDLAGFLLNVGMNFLTAGLGGGFGGSGGGIGGVGSTIGGGVFGGGSTGPFIFSLEDQVGGANPGDLIKGTGIGLLNIAVDFANLNLWMSEKSYGVHGHSIRVPYFQTNAPYQRNGVALAGVLSCLAGGGEGSAARTWEEAGISLGDATRIQNAATRTGQEITVIGSRAKGTVGAMSDWDYILSGPSRARHSAASSLPRGVAGGAVNAANVETGIDIFQSYNPAAPNYLKLPPTWPHVTFRPQSCGR